MTIDRVIPRLPGLAFGGDWNPEQWPEPVWDEDLDLMRQAGVNLVTVGVFSWAYLEPTPGEYTMDWLDRVLDRCLAAGISVDLATATASPPPWLGHRWPESLPVTHDGVRLAYGARQQYCPSSPEYGTRAVALAERIAERYAHHDAVVMWHVGNEYGAHVAECYCETCAEAFRDWLVRRYGSLDAINRAWSTAFWSQRYSSLDEVIPPRRTPYFPNPTQQLDFRRFSSDAMLALFTAERDAIRRHSPADKPITTNFMRFFPHADYWAWAAQEDVVSDDWYPDLSEPDSHVEGAAGADLMRSLGGGRPWLLMEQAVSAINWRAVNPPKRAGEYRRWSLQQVAHGADAVLHFQWRASVGGAEKWHSGMLPHAGPRTRTWRDVVALGSELTALADVAGARTRADVAVVFEWSSWWALELDSRPSTLLSMKALLRAWYEPLWRAGYAIDLVHPEADLSGYAAILVPQLYSVSDRGAASIVDAVTQGATAVVGFFSGAVDEQDRVRAGGYPAPWRDLLGLWIEEYRPLLPGDTLDVVAEGGRVMAAVGWSEHLHATEAEVLAHYREGDLDQAPAITRRKHPGGGAAWYLSAGFDQADLSHWLLAAVGDSAARPVLLQSPPDGVEVCRRDGTRAFLFLINHADEARTVDVRTADGSAWHLTGTGEPAGSAVTVAAGDVLVLHSPTTTREPAS